MNRRMCLVTGLLFLVSMVAIACGGGGGAEQGGTGGEADFKQNLQLGTGSTGGTYFPLGGEMATLLSEKVDIEGFKVSSVESGASIENMAKIGSGEFQLGMTINGTAVEAANGEGEFEGRPVENFGFITQIYPEVLHVVTLNRTGIETIEDLEGKKVAIGPPGSGTRVIAQQVLAAYGLNEGDYNAFEEDFSDAQGKLQDGNIDASFAVLGSPASGIDQLQATTKDVKYLEISGEPLQKITSETFYGEYEIPADTYTWLDSPVKTVSARAILVGSTDQVSPEAGYQIAKVLLENSDEISHPQAENMTKENALVGREDLPLHPGAEKYYEEEGMLE